MNTLELSLREAAFFSSFKKRNLSKETFKGPVNKLILTTYLYVIKCMFLDSWF